MKGRAVTCVGALVLVLAVIAFFPPVVPQALAHARTSELGEVSQSQILMRVPVTLINDQPVAAPNPFQQMVVIDSSKYSLFAAPNLQNIVWYYPNGTIIPAWIESGASSSSHSTVWWLRLRGFPPNSSLTVYMGFALPSHSFLSSRGPMGEAPQLSPVYGEYDDGALVFNYYTDFAGTSLPSGWTSGAVSGSRVSVDNMLIIQGDGSHAGSVYAATTTPVFGNDEIFEAYANQGNSGNYLERGLMGVSTVNDTEPRWDIGGAGDTIAGWSSGVNGAGGINAMTVVNGNCTYLIKGVYTNSAWWVYSVGVSSANGVSNVSVFIVTDLGETRWANSTTVNAVIPPLYANLGVYISGNGGSPFKFEYQWVRIRAYPPNGVMPHYVIGPAGPGAFPLYYYFLVNIFPITVAAIALAVFSTALTRSRIGAALRRNWGAPFLLEFTGLLLVAAITYSLGITSLADSLSVSACIVLVAALFIAALEAWRERRKRTAQGNGIKEGAR